MDGLVEVESCNWSVDEGLWHWFLGCECRNCLVLGHLGQLTGLLLTRVCECLLLSSLKDQGPKLRCATAILVKACRNLCARAMSKKQANGGARHDNDTPRTRSIERYREFGKEAEALGGATEVVTKKCAKEW